MVLRRADGFLAYHLATAVDEWALGISDVVRGLDLWPATGPQVAVLERLGVEPPRYWHLPLWLDEQGQRLSKRDGGLGLAVWREQGVTPEAAIGRLAGSLGLVPAGACLSAQELLQQCQLEPLRKQLSKA